VTPEKVAFRVVVFYEAAALATGGRWIRPWTFFLMKLSPVGRVCVSVGAGLWMLRHLEAFPVRHPRGRVLP
jgi:hypothetical protein